MKNPLLQVANMFSKNSKLNFQILNDLKLNNLNSEFIELISSTISSSILTNMNFFNASFLSTKLLNVDFEFCDLNGSDICSVWAKDCHFINTNFSNATISDTTFINCIFSGSAFNNVSMTRCQFKECTFEQFLMDESTFSLNIFSKCHIQETNFTESFYYQIFENCTFDKVHMNPVLLGYNFGFSDKTFAQLTSTIDLNKIDAVFKDKKLYINAAIFRMNQLHKYFDKALIACVAALIKMIQNDILIKADEIEFLKYLVLFFEEHKQISPISIIKIWQLLENVSSSQCSNTAIDKALPYIHEFSNTLYFKFINFENELQKNIDQFIKYPISTYMAELKIVYSEKPSVPLITYLSEFLAFLTPESPMPSLIRTEKGSYIEYHEIAVTILPYLQTFFSLLGVITPFVIAHKQNKGSKPKEEEKRSETYCPLKKTNVEITISPKHAVQSPILLPNVNRVTPETSNMISNVIKIVEDKQITNHDQFSGYNSSNVYSITITFQ